MVDCTNLCRFAERINVSNAEVQIGQSLREAPYFSDLCGFAERFFRTTHFLDLVATKSLR